MCPVCLECFDFPRDFRDVKPSFSFLFHFGFKNTECFYFLVFVEHSIPVLANVP